MTIYLNQSKEIKRNWTRLKKIWYLLFRNFWPLLTKVLCMSRRLNTRYLSTQSQNFQIFPSLPRSSVLSRSSTDEATPVQCFLYKVSSFAFLLRIKPILKLCTSMVRSFFYWEIVLRQKYYTWNFTATCFFPFVLNFLLFDQGFLSYEKTQNSEVKKSLEQVFRENSFSHQTKYFDQSKEIKQNWTGPKKIDIYLWKNFDRFFILFLERGMGTRKRNGY